MCHISCGPRPLGWILIKHPHYKRRNPGVHSFRQRWDWFVDVGDRDVDSGRSGKRALADKSFISDDAERVNIRSARGCLPYRLFWGQVLGSAHHHARCGDSQLPTSR